MDLLDAERWAATLADSGLLWQGFLFTMGVSLLGLALSLVVGTVLGVFSTTRSGVMRAVARVYVEFFQNTPIVVQVFFVYTAGPMILQRLFGTPHVVRIAPFLLVVVCVGLYHGAYMAEVIRTGIEAIPRGQLEGAQSQGFSRMQAYRHVILPQTFRIILPPLANQALNLVKNTSVLALIAGGDLMYQADIIVADTGYLQSYVICCAMYFLICFPLALLISWLERRSGRLRRPKASSAGTPAPVARTTGEV
ncbi:amino acid ABC transporter permease [Olsenella sp. HMSC062G07]|uniref:amino acid ABC transporter permease n=1 Tax=Olsenella sp. HMSC062G07 TaxID=1739330 RepID=UPI0008A31535|nr:amino acid ABC transporter permease [Olsenella sp. HMSC062G07]OFK23945.1 glutamine ABC transporter permease [Olsenella sp. HMSC062G07]